MGTKPSKSQHPAHGDYGYEGEGEHDGGWETSPDGDDGPDESVVEIEGGGMCDTNGEIRTPNLESEASFTSVHVRDRDPAGSDASLGSRHCANHLHLSPRSNRSKYSVLSSEPSKAPSAFTDMTLDEWGDLTCSDTDCSWDSEDSDYSSILSMFEQDLKPSQWMRKFQRWLDYVPETVVETSDEEDSADVRSLTSGDVPDSDRASSTPRQDPQIDEVPLLQAAETEVLPPDEPPSPEVSDEHSAAAGSEFGGGDGPSPRLMPAVESIRRSPSPERDLVKRQLLPMDYVERPAGVDGVDNLDANDRVNFTWRELPTARREMWQALGWSEATWNVPKNGESSAAAISGLGAGRKRPVVDEQYMQDLREARRARRRERKKRREKRRKRRDRRAELQEQRRLREAATKKELPETAEALIRRIMARAEREHAKMVQSSAKEAEERRIKNLIALGILDANGNTVIAGSSPATGIDVDFDLGEQLAEHPWAQRDYGDRLKILHETFFRPFTKPDGV